MPYRVEYASSARAACKGPKPCKGTKIGKGEVRFGSLTTFKEGQTAGFSAFQWRHYGCITPAIFANMKKEFEDIGELDGFEDLREEDQEKFKKAFEDGKVDPADVPESARKPEGEDEEGDDEKPEKKPAAKKRKAKKDAEQVHDESELEPKPKKQAKAPAKKAVEPPAKKEAEPTRKGSRKRNPKPVVDDDDEEEEEKPKKKARRASAKKDDSEDDE